MSLTTSTQNTLRDLNDAHSFMRNTPYVPDAGRDYWEPATPAGGDCEDIVLSARRLMIDRGWDYRRLLVTLVQTPAGAMHCVLLAILDFGELILDREQYRYMTPKSCRGLGYRFIMRQSPENPSEWEAIE